MNNTTELISTIANLALTLSFIAALIFGVAQVQAAKRDRRERLTLETLRTYQSREFAELLNYLSWHKMPKTLEDFRTIPDNERVMLIQFAQQMESLGMMVAEGLLNIDLVDKTLGSFVSQAWKKYEPVFTDMRVRNPDPYLGEYFQWMAQQIDKRMQGHPRKPFHELHAGHGSRKKK